MDKLTLMLLIAFVVVGIILAVVVGKLIFNMVSGWSMTNLPGEPVITNNGGSQGGFTTEGEPLQPANGPTPVPWDGKSRVTILLMGLREDEPISDTMMLVTIDPLNKTAGMLSIPRDIWIQIPGYDYNKINMAYYYGETKKLLGGGPKLAIDTVQKFLGVPINYYAQVDFSAFVRLIDEIGGVKLNITEEYLLDPIGKASPKRIYPGRQVLPGDLALAYARIRKGHGDDFGRASRQQEVIMAIRDRILEFDLLPLLIQKAPNIYNDISSGIRTNLSLPQAIQLGMLVTQIPRENITSRVISPPDMVIEAKSDNGLDILIPVVDKIRILRDEIFTSTGAAVAPSVIGESSIDLAKAEKARIAVQNGTSTGGLAEKTAGWLTGLGLTVVEQGNADRAYQYSSLQLYNAAPYTLRYLAEVMKVPSNRIFNKYDPNAAYDIVIVMGEDWASGNPIH